jgi:nucleoside-diphosphate-sugar epimerase
MRPLRVLITGGAGLIGSHIADALVDEGGVEIVVLDNFARGSRRNLDYAMSRGRVTIVEGDVTDRRLLNEVVQGIDVIFHQAAIRITQCAEDPRLAVDVLVEGTFRLLEAAVRHQVGKIVAASSASVYGMAQTFPTDELHHPYDNRTLYGAAKLFNEGLLRSFHDMYGLRYVALRYFNVYGPRMDVHGMYTEVLVRWLERIATGQPPIIFGDGLQTMDFVHVSDVAHANLLAARSPVDEGVFNIGTGRETSLNQLAQHVLDIMGSPLRVEHHEARKVNPVPRRIADISSARRALGFEPRVMLETGLATLVDWWLREHAAAA